ncbi:LytR family transcriptional regulator [Rubrobacter taiwanensis]|jgi:LCP family protein required for cell wall assembly|uniref:LytR family transcriptional regulator n=1 Tax=Rubrobacter taiwanensis TaxID=185139 RepID=A0A4R1BI80_9ACTN|nr:LCP family protein [Rubrobacter taiwanensis]TCJ16951.1 LytR family transcriptional regulator [Rubrobacter taiwanensis]
MKYAGRRFGGTESRGLWKRRQRARRLGFLALVLGVALLAGGAGVWTAEALVGEEPAQRAASGVSGRAPAVEALTVLVLGVDGYLDDRSGEEAVRTDVMMLVRLEKETGNVRVLSIPRDMYVEVEPGRWDRINSAFAYGGVSRTVEVVERFTGVQIDHYAIADFQGFERAVDALGGVEVEVRDEFPPGWRIGEGVQRLSGRQALLYARYRGTPGGDLDRIERQQQLVAALRDQVLRWESLAKVPEVAGVVAENVETDLSLGQLISLGQTFVRHRSGNAMSSMQLKGAPVILPDGMWVFIPDGEANEAILEAFRG